MSDHQLMVLMVLIDAAILAVLSYDVYLSYQNYMRAAK